MGPVNNGRKRVFGLHVDRISRDLQRRTSKNASYADLFEFGPRAKVRSRRVENNQTSHQILQIFQII